MKITMLAGFLLVAASLPAQSPPATTTVVLTSLTIKPEVERAQLMKVMPEEVRVTLKLYLDGKIQQWYGRTDGKGVMFIMNCRSVEEAKAITDTLPLSKASLANFEYTALGPLTPLRMLLGEPPVPSPKNP